MYFNFNQTTPQRDACVRMTTPSDIARRHGTQIAVQWLGLALYISTT